MYKLNEIIDPKEMQNEIPYPMWYLRCVGKVSEGNEPRDPSVSRAVVAKKDLVVSSEFQVYSSLGKKMKCDLEAAEVNIVHWLLVDDFLNIYIYLAWKDKGGMVTN